MSGLKVAHKQITNELLIGSFQQDVKGAFQWQNEFEI